jgi:hypothetical protein
VEGPYFQAVWLYPSGSTNLFTQARIIKSTEWALKAASFDISASAYRTFSNEATEMSKSLAPRWVTTTGYSTSAAGITGDDQWGCDIWVKQQSMPASVYNAMSTDAGFDAALAWLRSNGYNAPNRKYVVLMQNQTPTSTKWGGLTEEVDLSGDNDEPGLDSQFNHPGVYNAQFSVINEGFAGYLGDMYTPGDINESTYSSDTIAHEMTHAMGGVLYSAPNANLAHNPGHPTDCYDIMCYGNDEPSGVGTEYTSAGESYTKCDAWQSARLDCGKDDYFAPGSDTSGRAAWTLLTRWAVSSSPWLWGNPDVPDAAPAAVNTHSNPFGGMYQSDNGNVTTDTNGYATVTFAQPFGATPTVVAQGVNAGREVNLTSVDATGFTVRVLNAGGTAAANATVPLYWLAAPRGQVLSTSTTESEEAGASSVAVDANGIGHISFTKPFDSGVTPTVVAIGAGRQVSLSSVPTATGFDLIFQSGSGTRAAAGTSATAEWIALKPQVDAGGYSVEVQSRTIRTDTGGFGWHSFGSEFRGQGKPVPVGTVYNAFDASALSGRAVGENGFYTRLLTGSAGSVHGWIREEYIATLPGVHY